MNTEALKTTADIEQARAFKGSMKELVDEVYRLKEANLIDGYAIRSNSRLERVMGVRCGEVWAYLA